MAPYQRWCDTVWFSFCTRHYSSLDSHGRINFWNDSSSDSSCDGSFDCCQSSNSSERYATVFTTIAEIWLVFRLNSFDRSWWAIFPRNDSNCVRNYFFYSSFDDFLYRHRTRYTRSVQLISWKYLILIPSFFFFLFSFLSFSQIECDRRSISQLGTSNVVRAT